MWLLQRFLRLPPGVKPERVSKHRKARRQARDWFEGRKRRRKIARESRRRNRAG